MSRWSGLNVMESQHLLFNGSKTLREQCIDGITVNTAVLTRYMETTVGIVTALNTVIGYEKATELANKAYASGKGIIEVIREEKVLTEAQIKDLLDPVKLTNLDRSLYHVQTNTEPQSVPAHAASQENQPCA